MISSPSTEIVKSRGRAIFYWGLTNVPSLDFTSLIIDVRIYQRCSSLQYQLGSHGDDIEGVNQFLRSECEDVEESGEQGPAARLPLRDEGGNMTGGRRGGTDREGGRRIKPKERYGS